MNELFKYEGKKVLLKSISGNIFTGKVTCYFDKEENAPDFKEGGIILENVVENAGASNKKEVPYPMEFHESNIVSIEVIQ